MDNNKPVTELPVKAPFDFAKWWDRVGILIVLLVLLILMSTFAPNFNRVDNLLNIARSISVNAILAAGMTFVILTSGIDLSVGSIVAVSGVVSVVAAMAGLPAPLAILAGVGVGAVRSA
jgi:ribose transport system permease protein